MTAPSPHIGATFAQRAILRYRLEQRELEAERERFDSITAALQVDARLDRATQSDPVQMCAVVEDDEPLFTRAEAVIFALFGGASVGVFFASIMGWLS